MQRNEFRIVSIEQTFEDGTHLVETLRFPEISRFGANLAQLRESMQDLAREALGKGPFAFSHSRRVSGSPAMGKVTVRVEPPARTTAWHDPVQLAFDVVTWTQREGASIAHIPALKIEVVARTPEKLQQMVPEHIRFALMRTGSTNNLSALVDLARKQETAIHQLSVPLEPPDLQKAYHEASLSAKEPVLNAVGEELIPKDIPEVYERDELARLVAERLTGDVPSSVLLVGESGVGKTAVIYQTVRILAASSENQPPIWEVDGVRLVAGLTGAGQWQERCIELILEAVTAKAALCLGNLMELMETGKTSVSAQGVAGLLRPKLASGNPLGIAECTPDQIPLIEREDPQLLAAFHRIEVPEPTEAELESILLAQSVAWGAELDVDVQPQALAELIRLHARYAHYSAAPGRHLRFLRSTLNTKERGGEVNAQDVTESFSRESGLPAFLIEPSEPLDLKATRDWFSSRIRGQGEAIDLVIDLLARTKARRHKHGGPSLNRGGKLLCGDCLRS